MIVYRYAQNPYKPSCVNTHANTVTANGEGVFCFDLSRPVIRCTGGEIVEEEFTLDNLIEQFGDTAFGGQLHELDVDCEEIVSRGYGRYANMESDDWNDYVYIPECYVVFGEW